MKLAFVLALWSSVALGFESKYDKAGDKAKEAAMIQSGAQDKINDIKRYAEGFAMKQVQKLGVEKPLGVVLYCARVYREKSVSFPVARGKRLRLKLNEVSLAINF